MPTSTSNIQQLKRAVAIAEQIAELQAQLDQILTSTGGTSQPAAVSRDEPPKKRGRKKGGKMSAAGRARIVAAQKARWAKIREAKSALAAVSSGKARRGRRSR